MPLLRSVGCSLLWLVSRLLPKHPCCAVLMYHRIAEDGGRFAVSFDELRWQVADLRQRGFRFCTAERVLQWSPADGNLCAITFDDGYSDNLRALDLGIPITIFVTVAPIEEELGAALSLTDGETVARALGARSDCSIGSHGVTHRKWTKLTPDALTEELHRSKETLSSWFGRPVTTCAYPKGSVNDGVCAAAGTVFDGCFLADGGPLLAPMTDRLRIPRVGIFGNASRAEFRLRTSPLFTRLLPLLLRWK